LDGKYVGGHKSLSKSKKFCPILGGAPNYEEHGKAWDAEYRKIKAQERKDNNEGAFLQSLIDKASQEF